MHWKIGGEANNDICIKIQKSADSELVTKQLTAELVHLFIRGYMSNILTPEEVINFIDKLKEEIVKQHTQINACC